MREIISNPYIKRDNKKLLVTVIPISKRSPQPHRFHVCNSCKDELNRYIDVTTKDGREAIQNEKGEWVCKSCQDDILDTKIIQNSPPGSASAKRAMIRQEVKVDDRIARQTRINQCKRTAKRKGFGITNRK
jgi:hypothetical protein